MQCDVTLPIIGTEKVTVSVYSRGDGVEKGS